MKTITLDQVPESKARLAASYAQRHGVSLSEALLTASIDALASQEAMQTVDRMIREGSYPEEVVAAAEASSAKAAASRDQAPK